MLTSELLKLLLFCEKPVNYNLNELYAYAESNKLSYTLLQRIIDCNIELKGRLAEEYRRLSFIWEKIVYEAHKVSQLLEQNNVKHALFKTVKPYPTVTVDLDILVLDDVLRAYKVLRSSGYRVLGVGPESITLASEYVNIDLYRDVAVSRMIYFDKNLLKRHVVKTLFGDLEVYSISQEYDFIITARHAIIKEQMYTLADFYYTYLTITRLGAKRILDTILGLNDEPLKATILYINFFYNIIKGLGSNSNQFIQLTYPAKINIPTIIGVLLDLMLKNGYYKRIPVQMLYAVKPGMLLRLLEGVKHHLKRKEY